MNEAETILNEFASAAASRAGLDEPQRSEAVLELRSHLHESARRNAQAAGRTIPNADDAHAAIEALGSAAEVDAAFFAPHRRASAEAKWGRRVGAFAIDLAILLLIVAAVSTQIPGPGDPCAAPGLTRCEQVLLLDWPCVTTTILERVEGSRESLDEFHAGQTRERNVGCVVLAGASLTYFTALEATLGRTIGKLALGLRVTHADGTALGWKGAFARSAAKAFLPLLLLDWLIGMGTAKPGRLRVSDRIASTRVVRMV